MIGNCMVMHIYTFVKGKYKNQIVSTWQIITAVIHLQEQRGGTLSHFPSTQERIVSPKAA